MAHRRTVEFHRLLGGQWRRAADRKVALILTGAPLAGAVRDTVMLPHRAAVTVAFDAANSGKWPLRCHQLYHMASGMMTFVSYGGAN